MLVATATHDPNVYKSIRNIASVEVSPIGDLNAWSLLAPRRVLITRAALDQFKTASPGQAASAGEGRCRKAGAGHAAGEGGPSDARREPHGNQPDSASHSQHE